MRKPPGIVLSLFVCIILLSTCKVNTKTESSAIDSLDLKRGEVVSCGPQDGEMFGTVSFSASVPDNLKKDFNIAIALLYSFEYDESEKMFAKVIDQAPDCAMAYWGVAMSNFHQLWVPPSPAELKKGLRALQIARSIKNKTQREADYIESIAQFFENADQFDHRSRVLKFEKAMESIHRTYPDDKEATVFYALALNTAADPADKSYTRQRKAFELLNPIFQKEPLHPGIAHYIIHNCDYPELAELALPAARKYATIAPASAHAQHMPSHIFTRLGYWDECIRSNQAAASSAQCYAEQTKLKGHWDEELHCLDYLVYSYLQKGDYAHAKEQLRHPGILVAGGGGGGRGAGAASDSSRFGGLAGGAGRERDGRSHRRRALQLRAGRKRRRRAHRPSRPGRGGRRGSDPHRRGQDRHERRVRAGR